MSRENPVSRWCLVFRCDMSKPATRSSPTPSSTEGAVVAVVTRGADESFSLTETQENELLAAMEEIERGEYVTLEELLQSLPKHG